MNVNVIRGAAAALGTMTILYAVKRKVGQQTVRRLLSMIDPLEPSENDVATTLMETLNLDDLHNEIQEASGEVVAGAERRVVWASEAGLKTPLCVVFLHGWSSSSSECNPLPERIANALHANLFYNRLPGHGRTTGPSSPASIGCCGDALLREATPQALFKSAISAIRVGLSLGDRVVLVGCSTGAALATWLASLPTVGPSIAAMVLVSPAYALAHPLYPMLKHTFANLRLLPRCLSTPLRAWLIRFATGKVRDHPSLGAAYDTFNTLTYPTTAILHLIDTLWSLEAMDCTGVTAPTIMIGNPNDNVVDFRVKAINIFLQFGDTPKALHCITDAEHPHVVASELLSPSAIHEITAVTLAFLEAHLKIISGVRTRIRSKYGLGSFSRSYTSMKDLAEAVSQPLEF